ncbi:IclR family transcriptional regulator [Georgenia alba]|uniref:IclR family transcriptional regulator n=1 Tax=Georgenia alba TaxID=2233858 RepID=A0ABW2QEA1_9MICO
MRTDEEVAGRPQGRQHTVGVVAKALDVLEGVVWGEPQTIGELAQTTGIEKAAVYRILNTLVEHEFVVKDDETRTFAPGPRLYAAAAALHRGTDVVSLATPQMTALRDEFGETVNLGTLIDHEVQYLHILESSHSLRMTVEPGVRHPANSTALGKALLAQLGPSAARTALAHTPAPRMTEHSIVDPTVLEAELKRVRARGYAIDDQENELGAVCVAATIPPTGAAARHAISISGPATRMTPRAVERIGARLMQACSEVAELLPAGEGRDVVPSA